MGIAHYESYLIEEKKMAGNTVQAYIRDIKHFEAFIVQQEMFIPNRKVRLLKSAKRLQMCLERV